MDDGHFVYVIGIEDRDPEESQPLKIGVTRNIEKRIGALQTGNPEKLRLLAIKRFPSRETAVMAEEIALTLLDHFKMTGEWVHTTPFVANNMVHLLNLKAEELPLWFDPDWLEAQERGAHQNH